MLPPLLSFVLQVRENDPLLQRASDTIARNGVSDLYTTWWFELVEGRPMPVQKTEIAQARVHDEFAVESCGVEDERWSRIILRKIRKDKWEILDETGTEVLNTAVDTADAGPIVEWGRSYRQPSFTNIEKSKLDALKLRKAEEKANMEINVSPRRQASRKRAFDSQKKQACGMQKIKKVIDGKVKVGDIVHVGMATVDQTKVDGKNLTLVVVQINTTGLCTLAAKNGVLKTKYPYHRISVVKNATVDLMGLKDAFEGWTGMPKISERKASRSTSIVGGQGVVKCDCRGLCDTRRCKCFKADRKCNSRCHRNNDDCTNHD